MRDLDHYKLAEAVIEAIETDSGERPVYAHGAIWSVENSIWRKRTLEELGMAIARKYSGGRYCKRASDFRALAGVVSQLIEDNTFFDSAAIGIAGPGGFWRVDDLGNIIHEPLTPSHRQRLRIQSDPDPKKKPIRLLKLLADAFSGHKLISADDTMAPCLPHQTQAVNRATAHSVSPNPIPLIYAV